MNNNSTKDSLTLNKEGLDIIKNSEFIDFKAYEEIEKELTNKYNQFNENINKIKNEFDDNMHQTQEELSKIIEEKHNYK